MADLILECAEGMGRTEKLILSNGGGVHFPESYLAYKRISETLSNLTVREAKLQLLKAKELEQQDLALHAQTELDDEDDGGGIDGIDERVIYIDN